MVFLCMHLIGSYSIALFLQICVFSVHLIDIYSSILMRYLTEISNVLLLCARIWCRCARWGKQENKHRTQDLFKEIQQRTKKFVRVKLGRPFHTQCWMKNHIHCVYRRSSIVYFTWSIATISLSRTFPCIVYAFKHIRSSLSIHVRCRLYQWKCVKRAPHMHHMD